MGTIVDRGYVWKKGTALIPSFTAFSVIGLLEQHFPNLVDYGFTANMETDLDGIATGGREAIPWLRDFYFGDDDTEGLKDKVSERLGDIDARAINSIPLGVDSNGELIVARVGKFGPYVQRGEDTASIPDEIAPDELTVDEAVDSSRRRAVTRSWARIPSRASWCSRRPVDSARTCSSASSSMARRSRRPGRCSRHDARRHHLRAGDAATEPAQAGWSHPEDGQEIFAQNGRYGPYMKKGTDSRSLETEDQIFTVTLDKAVEIYAQPKTRRGQTVKPPLRRWATTRSPASRWW